MVSALTFPCFFLLSVKAGMKNKVILQLLCFKDRVLKLTAETRVMIDKKAKTVEREKIFFNLK
jgi:hypothetical protein